MQNVTVVLYLDWRLHATTTRFPLSSSQYTDMTYGIPYTRAHLYPLTLGVLRRLRLGPSDADIGTRVADASSVGGDSGEVGGFVQPGGMGEGQVRPRSADSTLVGASH